MRTASGDVLLLDTELRLAVQFLDAARRRHRRGPSAETTRALERAWADIDRLLDSRLRVTG